MNDFDEPEQFQINQTELDALDAIPTDLMGRSRIMKMIDQQLFEHARAINKGEPALLSAQDQERLIKTRQLVSGKPTQIHKGMVYSEEDLSNEDLDHMLREINDQEHKTIN